MQLDFRNIDTVQNYRSLRNNNLGNIKGNDAWIGRVALDGSGFVIFENIIFGIRAKFRDIKGDIAKGKNTIASLITEYAPPTENDTQNYINFLVQKLKADYPDFTQDSLLVYSDKKQMILLSLAIIKMEDYRTFGYLNTEYGQKLPSVIALGYEAEKLSNKDAINKLIDDFQDIAFSFEYQGSEIILDGKKPFLSRFLDSLKKYWYYYIGALVLIFILIRYVVKGRKVAKR